MSHTYYNNTKVTHQASSYINPQTHTCAMIMYFIYGVFFFMMIFVSFFLAQMDKSKTTIGDVKKKPKRLSRKQRRKPSQMKLEYERRQRRHKWLETHVWHAKRMKMCNKYGYKIAEHCSDKGIRQAYMSLTHGCLISVSLCTVHVHVCVLLIVQNTCSAKFNETL